MFGSPGSTQKITLDLIRHGEPEGGVRYRGSVDDPLSERGWQQMRHSVQQAQSDGVRWEKIFSSPMLRCVEFARELSSQQALELSTVAALKELSFGDLEGLTPQQAWDQYPALLSGLWEDPASHTPPNGEPYPAFLERISSGLDEVITTTEQLPSEQPHVLVVAHGGVIRATLTSLLAMPPGTTFRIEVPYAGITRLQVYSDADGTRNTSLRFINRYQGHR